MCFCSFVLNRDAASYLLDVDVFHDWDGLDVERSFEVQSTAFDGVVSQSSWNFAYGSDFAKGNALGLARAVQLRVSGKGGHIWGLNGVTFYYNPRGVKP